MLRENSHVDYIVFGEGERTFTELVKHLMTGSPGLAEIDGLAYFGVDGEPVANAPRAFEKDLDLFPSPFLSGVLDIDSRIGGANFQTTRGCPFTCTYCDYGRNQPYHEFSMARVRAELQWFKDRDARALYCVDSTFNLKKDRCYPNT